MSKSHWLIRSTCQQELALPFLIDQRPEPMDSDAIADNQQEPSDLADFLARHPTYDHEHPHLPLLMDHTARAEQPDA